LRSATETAAAAKSTAATEPAGTAARAAPARSAAAAALCARSARHYLRLHRNEALALRALSGELAGAAHRLRLLAGLLFRGLFVMATKLHLAEDALALHLFLERLEGLIDVVVTDENLHACSFCGSKSAGRVRGGP
jgi:hypothetical protein